jgi:pimeloyl-ACP methyl ester carboxylesterase
MTFSVRGEQLSFRPLAIWGTEDKIYDIRGADRLQRCIPGSQVIRLPKAGHLLLMENSEEATADYLRFVNVFHSKSTLPMS